jgi:hypothetical protein
MQTEMKREAKEAKMVPTIKQSQFSALMMRGKRQSPTRRDLLT